MSRRDQCVSIRGVKWPITQVSLAAYTHWHCGDLYDSRVSVPINSGLIWACEVEISKSCQQVCLLNSLIHCRRENLAAQCACAWNYIRHDVTGAVILNQLLLTSVKLLIFPRRWSNWIEPLRLTDASTCLSAARAWYVPVRRVFDSKSVTQLHRTSPLASPNKHIWLLVPF